MSRWVVRTPVGIDGPPGAAGGDDLPGSVGGLGMTWDLSCDDIDAAWPGRPAAADAVALTRVAGGRVAMPGKRIKRTLLLRVRPGTEPAVVDRFEADLAAMPGHIAAIGSWTLSRADHPRWTHAWEQEFADLDGLNADYLLHPYHWTCVDRWFDPEIPDSIVDPAVAHLYRWGEGPLLS
ncbi:hypothetical protein B7C42_05785 [Nocardia cerradoensis]|uniref:Stress-response A/B barrel domain-containing protein n=1 Tax=Nocardia cerradoensis TaxID=85688 RepID=A0A231GZZ1_9NOCA|nr:Dabb family protein [Nocardia cerradoensis]OXR42186.1 hypothetical protein B7C42_05785 [Nocardia cerradoensis]